MKYEIDLHIHTNASNDGSFLPSEIIDLALNNDMKAIAIADHNTCGGILQVIDEHSTKLRLIPAIEIDCVFNGVNLHVLGYGINPHNQEFHQLEEYMNLMEYEAGLKRVKLIEKEFQVVLDIKSIMKNSINNIVTGEAIAEALLIDTRYSNLAFLEPYRRGGNRDSNPLVNFYWDYCAQGKLAYVPLDLIPLDKAIKMIKNSGGIPILAHPGNNIHENEELLNGLIANGIEGIEAISSYHDLEQTKFYIEQANMNDLVISCGSDFHGKTKPAIRIGEFDYRFNADEIYQKLLERLEKNEKYN